VHNSSNTAQIRYDLYVVGSGLLSAVSLVLAEIIIQRYATAPLLIAVLSNALGGSILLLASQRNRSSIQIPWRRRDLTAVTVSALCAFGLSYLLGFDAVRRIGAGKTALLAELETPFVLVLAGVFLRERLSVREGMAGMLALIGAGLITCNPQSFGWTLSRGEVAAVLSPLTFAVGIIVIKPVLDKADECRVTGLLLLLGSALLALLIPLIVSSPRLGLVPLLIIAVIGLFRGVLWLAYNTGVKYIGASQSAILYLSYSFFAVVIQAGLAELVPTLRLQLPANLIIALVGGFLIAGGIVLLEIDSADKKGGL
jgi:drug/metabolite transporter (DMT)-like permease